MTTIAQPGSAQGQVSHRDECFIGGEWIAATGDRVIEVIDPSTEELVATVRESSVADVERSARAAREAFERGPWPALSPEQRADVLEDLAARLDARNEDLAQAATAEIGMPINMARQSQVIPGLYLRYYADLIRTFAFREDRLRLDGSTTRILREPVGPTAAIVPFNGAFPAAGMKLAPALAAGCTVVVKPSPETPLAVNLLGDVVAEMTKDGVLPPGVINVVVADREGSEALVASPDIDKVTFTGSTAVAKHIIATTGQRIGRVTLELGGKSAAIVLDDAPIDRIIAPLLGGGLINTGQACFGLTRVLVSERSRDELVDAMKGFIGALVVGDAHDPKTTTGPLAGPRHRDRVENYLAIAAAEGARVAVGGKRPEHLEKGFFFEPTVLVDVENSMRVAQEEIFGPVVSVLTYKDVDDAVAIANDTPYGLGGAVFGDDVERAYGIAQRIRTGTVQINCFVGAHVTTPFGGYRESGVGREGGIEGLEPFLESKSVHLPA
jgi:acyl-CoA reductase-like NAD-dependent aldehyde dehydrogenase